MVQKYNFSADTEMGVLRCLCMPGVGGARERKKYLKGEIFYLEYRKVTQT
jgi:hypothetical protein